MVKPHAKSVKRKDPTNVVLGAVASHTAAQSARKSTGFMDTKRTAQESSSRLPLITPNGRKYLPRNSDIEFISGAAIATISSL